MNRNHSKPYLFVVVVLATILSSPVNAFAACIKQYNYPCRTIPEFAPEGKWSVLDEYTYHSHYYTDGTKLHIKATNGSAAFFRQDSNFAGADIVIVRFVAWIESYQQPSWVPAINLGVAFSDGNKVIEIWPGYNPEEGRIFYSYSNSNMSTANVTNWFEPHVYSIVLYRLHDYPHALFWGATIYVDNNVVATRIPYDSLDDATMLGIDTPRIVAFGATDSVTVWDHIRYTIRDYPKDDDEDGYIDEECFSYAGDDCDDDDSSVHPSAIERCDLKDNDCDGFTDEGLELHKSCVAVAIGECRFSNLLLCQNGEYVCQPSEPQPEEGPGEGCNGKDDDCDGLIDEENDLCGPPPSCSPQPEICDGLDDDCDGSVDEAPLPDVGQQCNEAYPWPGVPHTAECNIGTWYCSTFGYLDCVSLDGGKPEQCDGMDNNCNGDVDENCLLQTSSPGGYMTGSGWQPSDCVFLTEAAELSACFQCMESLAPYPGTSSCSDDYFGCLAGFNDERGILLGPFPVPPAYPSGTYLLSYNFGDGGKTAYIKKITIIGQDEWVSQFPLAFDFIAYETEDLVTNPDFEQGVFLSQARVIRRLVDVPVPAGNKITFYFEPQIETRNLAIAIHGLRWWQDPDLADGDDSGCFTALESVTFQGGLLPEHTQLFDSDGDGLADGYEISLGLDPLAASVCELECLVYSSRIDNQGVENSLASKAANACRKYQKGNNIAAGNILNAFSNEVEAQRGNHIPESVADILVTYAEAVGQAL